MHAAGAVRHSCRRETPPRPPVASDPVPHLSPPIADAPPLLGQPPPVATRERPWPALRRVFEAAEASGRYLCAERLLHPASRTSYTSLANSVRRAMEEAASDNPKQAMKWKAFRSRRQAHAGPSEFVVGKVMALAAPGTADNLIRRGAGGGGCCGGAAGDGTSCRRDAEAEDEEEEHDDGVSAKEVAAVPSSFPSPPRPRSLRYGGVGSSLAGSRFWLLAGENPDGEAGAPSDNSDKTTRGKNADAGSKTNRAGGK